MSGPMDRIRETEEYKRNAEEMDRLIDQHGLGEAVRISAERDHQLGLNKAATTRRSAASCFEDGRSTTG